MISSCTAVDLLTLFRLNKAWRAELGTPSHWDPLLRDLDPLSVLGPDRLAGLSRRFSGPQLVSQLGSRLCSLCGEPTCGFFELSCSRVCLTCFRTSPQVKLCSLSFAKAHYMLSDKQAQAIPTLRVAGGGRAGSVNTLTTLSAAHASALLRWGSEGDFQAELARRQACARAAHKDKVAKAAGAKAPKLPRLLTMEHETNWVGPIQRSCHEVSGEAYGWFRLVNDMYFQGGPTFRVYGYEVDADGNRGGGSGGSGSSGDGGGAGATEKRDLYEAVRVATPGTTIVVSGVVELTRGLLFIDDAVMIVCGKQGGGHIEAGDDSIMVGAPCIMRNVDISRVPTPGCGLPDCEACQESEEEICPAVHILDDTVMEGCRVGNCPGGQGLMLRAGRLLARSCTFGRTALCGAVVNPDFTLSQSMETTLTLMDNTFAFCGTWGLQKGPACCHTQTDDEVHKLNKIGPGAGYLGDILPYHPQLD